MAKIESLEAAKVTHDREYQILLGVAVTMNIPEFRLRCHITKLEGKAERYCRANDRLFLENSRKDREKADLVDRNAALESEIQALKGKNILLEAINQSRSRVGVFLLNSDHRAYHLVQLRGGMEDVLERLTLLTNDLRDSV